ncbi:MAG: hypothetical protein Q8O67_08645 [Deltaproteobacteria bacterium]|nr:hypothetical protein [Deltaproteobacteria bacterium]
MGTTQFKPSWWSEERHGTAWQRVKEAMRRDWEQTKNDFTPGAPDLNQDVGDTVKQATGSVPMPPPTEQTPPSKGEIKHDVKKATKGDAWADVESRVAYGYAARTHYATTHPNWDDGLEGELRSEWNKANAATPWDEARVHVRRGFDAARV